MEVRTPVHAGARSIFLAGPTYSDGHPGWRANAIAHLKHRCFDGVVYSPEPFAADKNSQYEWETEALVNATCIAFWIPRDLDVLPGFTTNIEFGHWMRSGKCVLGYPENAPKMDYIAWWARKLEIPVRYDLAETLDLAMKVAYK